METTYFALGVLSMIAVTFIAVIVIGLIKVMRTEKNLTELRTESRNQFGDLHRLVDSNRTDFYRDLNETRTSVYRELNDRVDVLYRTLDEQIKECHKYTDKRVDKTLNKKED